MADDEGKLIDARCRRKITGHPENAQASHWSTHLVSDFLAHFTYLPEDVRVLSIRSGVHILPGWTKDLWLPHQKPQLAASPTAGSSRMEASADWPSLQKRGFLVVKRFLSAEQCAELAEHYNL